MKVKLIRTVPMDNDANPPKEVLLRPGEVHDLDDELAQRMVDLGAAEAVDEDGEEIPGESGGEDVQLPQRPSNGAAKDTWRAYLTELARVTDPEMDAPLVVPEDATRDQMVAIGDQRVKDFEEE